MGYSKTAAAHLEPICTMFPPPRKVLKWTSVYHQLCKVLEKRFSKKVVVFLGGREKVAHVMESGEDVTIFLETFFLLG